MEVISSHNKISDVEKNCYAWLSFSMLKNTFQNTPYSSDTILIFWKIQGLTILQIDHLVLKLTSGNIE